MPTGATINARVAFGFAKAGAVLGLPYQWYRPAAGVAGLDPSTLLGSVTTFVTSDPALKSTAPPKNDNPICYAAYDPTDTEQGDYLVGSYGTFFIASQFLPAPPSLIACNAVLTIGRLTNTLTGPSARAGGNTTTTPLVANFPAWLASTERRSTPDMRLPSTMEMASAKIFLPKSIGVQIQRGDVITTADALPARYNVQSADELLSYWQIVAVKAGG